MLTGLEALRGRGAGSRRPAHGVSPSQKLCPPAQAEGSGLSVASSGPPGSCPGGRSPKANLVPFQQLLLTCFHVVAKAHLPLFTGDQRPVANACGAGRPLWN